MAWVPVGKVWAKEYSRLSVCISFASEAPSLPPASAIFFDSVIAWPLWFRLIRTAMSFLAPPTPFWTP